MKHQGQPVAVRSCGLVLDTNHRYLGASPDGMVFDSTASPRYGLLEIKCPFSAYTKKLTIDQAANEDRSFCVQNINGRLQLNRNHAYHWQIQGQLSICRLRWCDFFVWLGDTWFVERIEADMPMWLENMLPALQNFYFSHAVPYLQHRNRPVSATVQPTTEQEPLERFERLLPEDLCQSRIDGRNGSNACTFIALLFLSNA